MRSAALRLMPHGPRDTSGDLPPAPCFWLVASGNLLPLVVHRRRYGKVHMRAHAKMRATCSWTGAGLGVPKWHWVTGHLQHRLLRLGCAWRQAARTW